MEAPIPARLLLAAADYVNCINMSILCEKCVLRLGQGIGNSFETRAHKGQRLQIRKPARPNTTRACLWPNRVNNNRNNNNN